MTGRHKDTTRNAKPKAKPRYRIPPPIRPLKTEWPEELRLAVAAIREAAAARRLSRQTKTVELCRCIIAEAVTPLREAVEAGKMKAGEALRGMEEEVDQLMAHLWSSERFRLKERVRGSDEWWKFEKAIAEAEKKGKARLAPERKPIRRQRQDLTRAMIATVKRDHPETSSIEKICKLLDEKPVPLRKDWKNLGFKTWHEIWTSPKYRPRVKRYISDIKPAAPEKEQQFS